jgi:acyl-coenzyme A synthetase/AMP-(fatty) acid ligase
MTELGGGTHFAPDGGEDRPESIGRPLPGVECRVVDCATGADVGPGQPGKLLVRAPGAMRVGNPRSRRSSRSLGEFGLSTRPPR